MRKSAEGVRQRKGRDEEVARQDEDKAARACALTQKRKLHIFHEILVYGFFSLPDVTRTYPFQWILCRWPGGFSRPAVSAAPALSVGFVEGD